MVDKNKSTPLKGSPADGANSAAVPVKDQQLVSQGGATATEEGADLKKKASSMKKEGEQKKPQEADVKMQEEEKAAADQDKANKPKAD